MTDKVIAPSAASVDIESRLAQIYGRPQWNSHGPPLDELVATILSQHTSDVNSGRAYAELRARFPTWRQVLEAAEIDVAEAIQSGGLANVKAPRIQRVLRVIETESGSLSLDWLKELPLDTARTWLLALPGVGPKTATCVLLFSLGMPTMPVDTHVHRVAGRLGLLPPGVDADEAHAFFDRLMGPNRDAMYALHLNLIRHGRTTCTARAPACGVCALSERCPSAFRVNGASSA